jgi:ribonuclease HI
MAKKANKFYVVWHGVKPGIYTDWNEAKKQVEGFDGAKYKAFESQMEAEKAFKSSFKNYYKLPVKATKAPQTAPHSGIIKRSLAVDAACSGNPGLMEYRGVSTESREQIFHQGPFKKGTNNIGEFLALVHGLAYLKKHNHPNMPIYTDSRTALAWVRNKKVKTELVETPDNEIIFELIDRALNWLENNTYQNPLLKWETEIWGEIPADFGRK